MSRNKKARKHGNTLLQFVKDNKIICIVAASVIAVLAAAGILIAVIAGSSAKSAVSEQEEIAVTEELQGEEAAEDDGLVPLELDAYPEVNELMQQYYAAVTVGDRSVVKSLTDITDEESLLYIELRSVFIESYNDLKCYTKVGPIDNSYVVYVSYNVKFHNIERQVPGVSPFLIYPREDGTLYIHEGEVSEDINQYLETISVQDDVVDLMNEVQVAFNETILNDEGMNNFLAEMKEELQIAVGEALVDYEAAQGQVEQIADNPVQIFEIGSKVTATEVVNVRESDSEQAEKLGKLQPGVDCPVLESKANGWTKIKFEGKEGYVSSDYLTVTQENMAEQTPAEAEEPVETDDPEEPAEAELPSKGTIKVGATVNIRKEADQESSKIAVCYQGEKLEILEQQEDGWTKVKFNGKTGYVKTSVLEVLD